MEIFLCRHGETEQNNNGIVQGQMDGIELNQKGLEQAEKLAGRFESKDIDKIYSSSLDRARRTAEIVADLHDHEVETSDLLKEVDRAEFEGKQFEEMIEVIDRSDSESHEWSPKGGETLAEMQKRGMRFLEDLKERHEQDERIVVVAHGGINCSLVLGVLGRSAEKCYLIHQDNCCVNKFELTDRHGFEVIRINDISHL